jgi:hypothetical protein
MISSKFSAQNDIIGAAIPKIEREIAGDNPGVYFSYGIKQAKDGDKLVIWCEKLLEPAIDAKNKLEYVFNNLKSSFKKSLWKVDVISAKNDELNFDNIKSEQDVFEKAKKAYESLNKLNS